MEKVKLPEDGSVQEALKRLHQDGDEAWVAISYSNKNTLCVVGEGEGSLDAARTHFGPKEGCYVLIRKKHQVEMARTHKFAFVCWVPDSAPPMRKSLLSTHKGQVKDIFLPFHVFLDCADSADVDGGEDEIMGKIGFSSGTKLHVTNKEVYKAPTNVSVGGGVRAAANKSTNIISSSVQASQDLSFADKEAFDAAYTAVKSDKDDTDWLLLGYENIKTLKLLGCGSGGVDELASHLDDKQTYYAYFRVTEQYDKTLSVKFCSMKLMSQDVSPVQRSKMATHTGFLSQILSPVHVTFDLSDYRELNSATVANKVGSYSGTKSHVTAKEESKLGRMMVAGSKPTRTTTIGGSVDGVSKSSKIGFEDEEGFKRAITNVRSDDHANVFMVGAYVKKYTLGLLSEGSGGFDEFVSTFDRDKACFGLYRTTDEYDGHTTVKFVYIKYQPASLSPMARGEIGTLAVEIDPIFSPAHVDLFISELAELTEESVLEKVKAASGSAIHHS